MNFADALTSDQVVLALIALMGAVTAGFFKLISQQSKNQTHYANNLDKNTKQLGRIATATERGNREAENRNSHLAELVVQGNEKTQAIAEVATKTVIKALQTVPEQHVEHQHIEQAVIEKKIEKKKE